MTQRKTLLSLLGLVWLFGLVAGYFIVHKPFTGEVILTAALNVVDILAIVGTVVLAGAVGTLNLRDETLFSALERAAMRALTGLGLLSIAILVGGLVGLSPPTWLAWIILVAALMLLRRRALAWALAFGHGIREAWQRGPRFWRWAVLFLLALAFIGALAPPTKWDSLVYHLAGPQTYLRAGHILSVPDNHFLSFPQLTQMHYLWLMTLARPQTAALMHFSFGVLMLALLLGLAGRLADYSAGWLATLVLLVSDSLWGEFLWPYADLSLMAYALAALIALNEGKVLWAGLFVGMAVSIKYTAIGVAAGAGLLTLWRIWRREAPIRALVALIGLAALIFAPWVAKNTLLEGNPVAPFLFGAPGYDDLDAWYYLRPGTGLSWWELVIAPLTATLLGVEAGEPYLASTGALLLPLLLLVALRWREMPDLQRSFATSALLFTLPPYLIWLAGMGVSWFLVQTRLLFAVFPALAMVGALGFESLTSAQGAPVNLGWLARAAVNLVIIMALIASGLTIVQMGALPVALGLRAPEDYLLSQLGTHWLAMSHINTLPADSRVLLLWEPRTFYCDARCIPDSLINRWWHDRQVYSDPLVIAQGWRDQGATHVLIFEAGLSFLVNEEGHEPLTADDLAALNRLREEAMTPIWTDGVGSYTLYQLEAP